MVASTRRATGRSTQRRHRQQALADEQRNAEESRAYTRRQSRENREHSPGPSRRRHVPHQPGDENASIAQPGSPSRHPAGGEVAFRAVLQQSPGRRRQPQFFYYGPPIRECLNTITRYGHSPCVSDTAFMLPTPPQTALHPSDPSRSSSTQDEDVDMAQEGSSAVSGTVSSPLLLLRPLTRYFSYAAYTGASTMDRGR